MTRTLADVPPGEKAITTLEARRRLHGCQQTQIRHHVTSGALTPYREGETEGHTRIFYLESEVDALAEKWKPKRRRRRFKREATRNSDAAKVLPLIQEGRSFDEICFISLVHPDAVAEIIESLKLGENGAPLKRLKVAQETLNVEQARTDMQVRRAETFYDLKKQAARHQHNLDRRLERDKKKAAG